MCDRKERLFIWHTFFFYSLLLQAIYHCGGKI